jgi:hypothetical protein
MIQRRDGSRFALETFAELSLGDFNCDDAVEVRVTGLVNIAHATLAN